ncbi:hypothetical protein [Bacillus sp. NPDC094106]|uniref:hypothetical protein n=1 Tax=Bacillus sp. NPDC094106 TaxID=3363949 RepID=UPI00380A59CF
MEFKKMIKYVENHKESHFEGVLNKNEKNVIKRDDNLIFNRSKQEETQMIYEILNDYEIRRYKPKREKSALIRVLEPEYKKYGVPYEVKYLESFSSVIELYFHDIREIMPNNERFVLFNEEMAKEVIQFIDEGDFDEIVVHCNAGQSRSAGIMYGISLLLKDVQLQEDITLDSFYMPNPVVIHFIRQALEQ